VFTIIFLEIFNVSQKLLALTEITVSTVGVKVTDEAVEPSDHKYDVAFVTASVVGLPKHKIESPVTNGGGSFLTSIVMGLDVALHCGNPE